MRNDKLKKTRRYDTVDERATIELRAKRHIKRDEINSLLYDYNGIESTYIARMYYIK